MSEGFATLLSSCMTRIDKFATAGCSDASFKDIKEKSGDNTSTSPVRSEIKNIIFDKLKQEASPELLRCDIDPEKQVYSSDHNISSAEDDIEKPKILFSLKDFLDRSEDWKIYADQFKDALDDENVSSDESEEFKEKSDDDESDVISDSSDLEVTREEDESGTERVKEPKSDTKCLNSDDSDFESDLNLMDELKQKQRLKENIADNIKSDDGSVCHDDDDSIEGINQDNTSQNNASSSKENFEGSNFDPIDIDDDSNEDSNEDLTSNFQDKILFNKAKLALNGISISVVGKDVKNINLETLLVERPTVSKDPQSKSPLEKFDNLSHSQRSSLIVSSNEANEVLTKRSKSVLTVTLDEKILTEDISNEEENTESKEDDPFKYDNCSHGDLADYICAGCSYSKWRSERGIVKNPQSQTVDTVKSQGLTIQKVFTSKAPEEIFQEVNSDEVLKFAGFVSKDKETSSTSALKE